MFLLLNFRFDSGYVLATDDRLDSDGESLGKYIFLTFNWSGVGTSKDGWYPEADLALMMDRSADSEKRSLGVRSAVAIEACRISVGFALDDPS